MGIEAAARVVLPRAAAGGSLDDLERLLRTGVEVTGSRAPMGERGVNGFMDRLLLADPLDPARTVQVLQRPAEAQAVQEAFGWSLARRAGADYLFPAAVVRDDGTAMVQLRAGRQASAAGVFDAAGLEQAAGAWYRLHMPGLAPAHVAEQARVDRELLLVMDYLTANPDRGPANLLVDSARGGFTGIDMGWASGGERLSGRATPRLMQPYAGGSDGVVQLHPRTVELVRANLGPQDLRELHGQMRRQLEAYRPAPQ